MKRERSFPQVRERRRQKVRGRAGVTSEAKPLEFELQESGCILRGTLFTHERDERDEIDVLRVFSQRGKNRSSGLLSRDLKNPNRHAPGYARRH